MMIKAIIVDFDGVLFDSEPLHLQACNQVFQALGFFITPEKYFKDYVGIADREMFAFIFKHQGLSISANETNSLILKKIQAFRESIETHQHLQAIQGISQFLQSLNSKFIFGICSGANPSEIQLVLSKLEQGNLKKYFSIITTREDVNHGKPSPEGYLKTAKKLKVIPEHCLAVEDTPIGIAAAKAANMRAAALTTTHPPENLQNADKVMNTFFEIEKWITSKT